MAREFGHRLASASSVVIGSHVIPDGDALGSSLAVSLYLDTIGVKNEVLNHNLPSRNLQFLPGIEKLKQTGTAEFYDLAVMVDLDPLDRLGSIAPYFENCSNLVVVDHHIPNKSPGDLRIIDTKASATAAILTKIFVEIGAEITPAMATCLLTGIVTDTGSFRYRNTNPESMSLSALLLERGADINLISEEVYQRNTLGATQLYGHMLDTMRLANDDQLAMGILRFEDYQRTGATDEDAEEFGNQLLFIDGVQIAAILRESIPGKVRCSIRSREGIDVATVARGFGGGGRVTAAGCTFEKPVPEVEEILMKTLGALLI